MTTETPRKRAPKQYALVDLTDFEQARIKLGWSTRRLYEGLSISRSSWQRFLREGSMPLSVAMPAMMIAYLRERSNIKDEDLNRCLVHFGLPELDEEVFDEVSRKPKA